MCSNVDQVVIVCAPEPRLNPFLIDRYLCAAAHMRTNASKSFQTLHHDHGIDSGGNDDSPSSSSLTHDGRKRRGHELQLLPSGGHKLKKEAIKRLTAAINDKTHNIVDGITTPLTSAIICCNKIDLLDQLSVSCHITLPSLHFTWFHVTHSPTCPP
jgi:hypothetical protein